MYRSPPKGPVPDGRKDEEWKEMDKKAQEIEACFPRLYPLHLARTQPPARPQLPLSHIQVS